MEDGDVVAAFLGGEERAFQELVSRYQTRLLNFIYRTISDCEKAEDLVQEVFIRVYRHIGRLPQSVFYTPLDFSPSEEAIGCFMTKGRKGIRRSQERDTEVKR